MNNFYTILVIPEKTKQVKKVIIPAIYVKIGFLLGSVGIFFIAFMIYDYVNVMRQLSENKRLQTENRQLKQQMQTYTTKLQSVEDALERIQSYTTKLRIITDQAGENTDALKKKIAPDLPGTPMDDHSEPPASKGHGSLLFSSRFLLASNEPADAIKLALAQQAIADPTKTELSDLIREDEQRESAALRAEFDKLNIAFDSVLGKAVAVEVDVQSLTTALYEQKDRLASIPTLKPTAGWFTSGFGERNSPFTGKQLMHEGLDLANHVGSPIVSPAAGIVSYAGPKPGYGNLISIDQGYGIRTQYGHVSKIYVKMGDKIKRGQKIGAVGNTGRSTGPHVHYEVRVNGVPMDPFYYILED